MKEIAVGFDDVHYFTVNWAVKRKDGRVVGWRIIDPRLPRLG